MHDEYGWHSHLGFHAGMGPGLGIIGLGVWLGLCGLVGWLAARNGRSGVLFFLLSLILSPLIGLVIALIAGKSEAARAQPAAAPQPPAGERAPGAGTYRGHSRRGAGRA
jgi:hypothetical protein